MSVTNARMRDARRGGPLRPLWAGRGFYAPHKELDPALQAKAQHRAPYGNTGCHSRTLARSPFGLRLAWDGGVRFDYSKLDRTPKTSARHTKAQTHCKTHEKAALAAGTSIAVRAGYTQYRVQDVTILSRATRVLSGGAKGLDGGNSIYVPPAAGGTVGAIQTLRPIAFPRPPPVPSPVPRSLSPRLVARGESGKGVGIRRGGTRGSLCAVGAEERS